jgi:hypothetical protein
MRACLPYFEEGKTDAAQSQDGRVDVLLQRVTRLESRIAQLEKHVASQDSAITRLRSAPIRSELWELQQEIDYLKAFGGIEGR